MMSPVTHSGYDEPPLSNQGLCVYYFNSPSIGTFIAGGLAREMSEAANQCPNAAITSPSTGYYLTPSAVCVCVCVCAVLSLEPVGTDGSLQVQHTQNNNAFSLKGFPT